MKFADVKTYKLELFFFSILVVLSYALFSGNDAGTGTESMNNYFWVPSTVMQSIAAVYAVFIAIFALSLQRNLDSIHSIANRLKPPLKIVSYTAVGSIYLNGLMLIIFSLHSPSELKIELMLFTSLLSLVASLIAIVYLSMEMLSDVSGLKTSSEKFTYLSNLLRELEGWSSSGQMELSSGDVELCIQGLDDEKPEVRIAAAQLLGWLGDEQAVDALLRKLADKNPRVRETAVEALGRVGDENIVAELIGCLEDKNKGLRLQAVRALSRLGDERAIDPLVKKLEDKAQEVQAAAAEALGNLRSRDSVDALLKKLEETQIESAPTELQMQVLTALGKIGDEKALAAILSRLDSPYPDIRKNAAEALGNLRDEKAVPHLVKKLADISPEVRNASAYALGNLGDKQAVFPLLGMLEEPDPELRITAVYALGNLRAPQAISPLINMLDDDNPWVRKCAAEALGKIGDIKATDPLVKNLDDPDSNVRWAAAEALRMLDKRNLRKEPDGNL
ncbi:HEAT repeat domain-containing protein [Methanosarcina sp. T3]|uniref:HEAT repeat domain-containing protein n=1 Tax=Methanosarcina sp. T3 TaxID=3439062 RepID=UPI003F8565DB